jgi:hypothetical protein
MVPYNANIVGKCMNMSVCIGSGRFLCLLLLPTLIPLSGVGTTCFFHHVVIKIRQLFLRTAACLMSTLLETGVGSNDYKCNRDQRLNVPSEARIARTYG